MGPKNDSSVAVRVGYRAQVAFSNALLSSAEVFENGAVKWMGINEIRNFTVWGAGKSTFLNQSYVSKLTVRNLGTLVLYDTLRIDSAFIINGGMVTHEYPSLEGDNIYKPHFLSLTGNYVEVGTGSSINVSGRGFAGGYRISALNNNSSPSGTHGGYGYQSIGNSNAYDNFAEPVLAGEGGGFLTNDGSAGGYPGGGVIRLNCLKLVLNGSIFANALSGTQQMNLGAGGSIWITSKEIIGNGTIQAYSPNPWGSMKFSGGGGRIALHSPKMTGNFLNNLYAYGYGAGTIFLKDSTNRHGNLILDNRNNPAARTPLPGVGKGTIQSLTADTLKSDISALAVLGKLFNSPEFPIPGLKGLFIEVNPVQTPNDSNIFKIIWNDSNTIVVDTTGGKSLTDRAQPGNWFRGIIRVDTLKVKNCASWSSMDTVVCKSMQVVAPVCQPPLGGMQKQMRISPVQEVIVEEPPPDILENGPAVPEEGIQIFFKEEAEKEIMVSQSGKGKEPILSMDSTEILRDKGKEQNLKLACADGDPVYTYNSLDQVTSMTSPAGTTKYEYDSTTGRLAKIISPQGKEFGFHYDHGQLQSMRYPNGITANYAFDANGNLTDLHYKRGDNSTVQRFQYGYDPNNMRTSMTDNDGLHSYEYDPIYQIIKATNPTPQNPLEQFTYDEVGNRKTVNGEAFEWIHNELNQLLESDSFKYEYDADGNQTLKVNKFSNDSVKMEYDIENHLVKVETRDTVVEYACDAIGRRMAKIINGNATEFRYDGQNLILEMTKATSGGDSITASYTFGPEIDQPLQMNRGGNNYYYHADGLGSIAVLTDESGNVVQEYKYSAFGKIVSQSGNLENPFTYTGREYDKETGNYFYRARYYDPHTGRFISEDPIEFSGGDFNFYRYVWNSTINTSDPMGLTSPKIIKGLKYYYDKVIDAVADAAQSINAKYRTPPEEVKQIQEITGDSCKVNADSSRIANDIEDLRTLFKEGTK